MAKSARSTEGATVAGPDQESQALQADTWLDPIPEGDAGPRAAALTERARRILQDPTSSQWDRASATAWLVQVGEPGFERPSVDAASSRERPTTGRVVHYHDGAYAHLLALVNVGETGDELERVGLVVIPAAPNGAIPEIRQVYVSSTPGDGPGEWHWPER